MRGRTLSIPLSIVVAVLLLLLVVVPAALFARAPRTAEAHAVLVRSSPAGQAELAAAPPAIDLWFSEPLEPQFSTFELFAAGGEQLPIDALGLDPADDRHLSGLPRRLDPGVYTVVYRTLSTRDGHDWHGAFTFTVLNADGSLPAGGAFTPSLGARIAPGTVIGRWFTFTGFAVVLGGALMAALARGGALSGAVQLLQLRLSLAALPLLAGGALLQLEGQRERLDASLGTLLTQSRFGTWWSWRAVAVLGIAVLLVVAFGARQRYHQHGRSRTGALVLALGLASAGGLFTVSMLSHAAAAPGTFWAVLADTVHLVASALWFGGVLVLAVVAVRVRASEPFRAAAAVRLAGRFSPLAAVALYVLAVSGLLRSVGELPTAAAITDSAYGQWLIAKLVLVALVMAVAFGTRSALQRWGADRAGPGSVAAGGLRRFRWQLATEVALLAIVLGAVAVLGQLPTSRGGADAGAAAGIAIPFNAIEQVDDLNIHLQVTPAAVGPNELQVHVYRDDGTDPGDVQRVQVLLSGAAGAGGDALSAVPEGDGIFTATGTLSGLSTDVNVSVDVRRAGFDDARTQFVVPVRADAPTGAGQAAFGSPAPQLTSNFLWGLLLLPVGAGAVVAARGRRSKPGAYARFAGGATVFVALVLALSGDQHAHVASTVVNPNPGDPAAVARGGPLFVANCASCHGERGRGDGPGAANLNPRPANLAAHIPLHTEAETFFFVSDGFGGTAMSGWKDRLSEQQMWDIVNFLRAEFAAPAP